MHPTPKKPSYSKVSTIKFLCMVCYTIPSIFLFYLSSKLNLLCKKLVIKALTNLIAHFIFLALINLNHCVICVVYACTYTLELAEPCCHGERFQHCTYTLYSVDIMRFCLWMSPV